MVELKEIKEMKDKAANILVAAKKIKKTDLILATVQTDNLKVNLTQDDLLKAGEDLAKAMREANKLEEEKKQFVASIAAKIKEQEGKGEAARQLIQNKYDYKKTDCINIMDNTVGLFFTVRMDTEEIITERKMTSDERQSKINWPDEEKQSLADEVHTVTDAMAKAKTK